MGIKLKWFRHRLTFDSIPTESSAFSNPSSSSSFTSRLRRSKSEAVIVTGYYRRSLDEEATVQSNVYRDLPPVKERIRNQYQIQSLPPAPSMPSLTETSPEPVQRDVMSKRPIKVEPPTVPLRVKETAPAPPVPPKRKEQRVKAKAPPEPPGISKEDVVKVVNEDHIPIQRVATIQVADEQSAEIIESVADIVVEIQPQQNIISTLEPQLEDKSETIHKVEAKVDLQNPPQPEERQSIFKKIGIKNQKNPETIKPAIEFKVEPSPDFVQNFEGEADVLIKPQPTIVSENELLIEDRSKTSNEEEVDFVDPLPERPTLVPEALSPINIESELPVAPSITIDTPPPLPTSAPPLEDPKPWFEVEEQIVDNTISTTPRTSNVSKQTLPIEQATERHSNPTDELPLLPGAFPRHLTPAAVHASNGHAVLPLTPKEIAPETLSPQSAQKQSKLRAFFGLSPKSPEPPKPKSRRIRVPKQKSPKASPMPLPRTISVTSSDSKPMPIHLTTEAIDAEPIPGDNSKPNDQIIPGKSALAQEKLPEAALRKANDPAKAPKQLSFAETATVFSEEDDSEDDHNSKIEHNGFEDDNSWDLVAKHRANISQNAQQVKAAANRPRTAVANTTDKRVDFVPIERPRTMREMRKSQSTGAGVNLRNKDQLLDDSDTEA